MSSRIQNVFSGVIKVNYDIFCENIQSSFVELAVKIIIVFKHVIDIPSLFKGTPFTCQEMFIRIQIKLTHHVRKRVSKICKEKNIYKHQ